MKRLFFVRHSYAANHRDLSDRARPLTDEGRRSAIRIAVRLQNAPHIPDHIVSSPATRALETAEIFAEEFGYPLSNIVIKESLYDHLSLFSLYRILGEIDNDDQTVYLFGHNPAITEIPLRLSGEFRYMMPPCGVVGLEFDVERWTKINEKEGRLIIFEKP